MLLRDKVCVVVGAGSLRGIGYATAELFAEHGARIVAVDIQMNDRISAEIKSAIESKIARSCELLGVKCDISSEEDCAAAFASALAHFGRVDALVNCAGVVQSKAMLDIRGDELARMISVNLNGTFILCQQALKVFEAQQRGAIVNVASVAAQRGGGLVGGAHYAASKGGVVSLTRSIAREFGPRGIRANVVCPAMIETGMLDGVSPERFHQIVSATPLQRVGHPLDVAGACLFLVSDLSAYVTGATIDVNGGSHIH